jgi:hypothetical protein
LFFVCFLVCWGPGGRLGWEGVRGVLGRGGGGGGGGGLSDLISLYQEQ